MDVSQSDRIRMERAHVRAWPALRTERVEGWLWRLSGGGSQRANSVSTIEFHGDDPDAAIAQVEALYAAADMPPRFQTFDETEPPFLPDRLQLLGYRQSEATITMFKQPTVHPSVPGVEMRDVAWDAWRSVYLAEITENRRRINNRILDGIPAPAAFFAMHLDGAPVATALCAVDAGCGVVECVATNQMARRRGAARAVMLALESWASLQGADLLGLQVVQTNAPAVNLYASLGFVPGAINRFWVRDG